MGSELERHSSSGVQRLSLTYGHLRENLEQQRRMRRMEDTAKDTVVEVQCAAKVIKTASSAKDDPVVQSLLRRYLEEA